MDATNVKDEARRLVEALPEDSTWEDLMHLIYVRQTIEAGRVTDVGEVRSRFNPPR